MEELIEQLKTINSLSELQGEIDNNVLLMAIVKAGRISLLKEQMVYADPSNRLTFRLLVDFCLEDYYALEDLSEVGFVFPKEEIEFAFKAACESKQPYVIDYFLSRFFSNVEDLDKFVQEHKQFIRDYIRQGNGGLISDTLKNCDSFIKLLIEDRKVDVIRNPENLSVENLKLLAEVLKNRFYIFYIWGTCAFAKHVIELKDELEPGEVCRLLDTLVEKTTYESNWETGDKQGFTHLVEENSDYLIELVTASGVIPKCLIESIAFRDECLKRQRYDLAVQCILPENFFDNEELVEAYAKELGLDPKELYERGKWLLEYYKNNNNIFNSILGTSLKNEIFNLNEEHYERFINDIDIQMDIAKLNNKELIIFGKILSLYNYKDFDTSMLVVNVAENIKDYKELIDSIDLSLLTIKDLKAIVAVLQLPGNQYHLNNIEDVRNYKDIKREYFTNNFASSDIEINKNNILKYLFNIDLGEAKYINKQYCTDGRNNNILERLRNSELPKDLYNYLLIINKIIKCEDETELSILFSQIQNVVSYDKEIPFEAYLRSRYTELYARTLYRPVEKQDVYGPKDNISQRVLYNGKSVQVFVPRAGFNFLIHCLGSCSLATDVTDTNYSVDWLERPQIQDHIIACSYINEKGIHSIRSNGSIIFGFNALEGGSILAMGWTDIDSLGRYAKRYNGTRELQDNNGDRARYAVPSELLRTISDGYNEVVVERRNNDKARQPQFKRKPDYIIMMAEDMYQSTFDTLETVCQTKMTFITEEDKVELTKVGTKALVMKFLLKYKEDITRRAQMVGLEPRVLASRYADLILKAKYYEDCLKAASEFGIPLIIVDKTYYFKKLLSESVAYDEETKEKIASLYEQVSTHDKAEIYRMVVAGESPERILSDRRSNVITISA